MPVAPTQDQWGEFIAGIAMAIRGTVATYLHEQDANAFGGRMLSLLEDAHTQAVYLGRQRAGDFAPLEDDDRKFAQRVMDGTEEEAGEASYLAAFVDDLNDGERYVDEDGEPGGAAIERRALMYTGAITGTANEAWSLAQEPTVLINWMLGSEAPCGDCPGLAEGSPYLADELPTVPGGCETACLFNCKCYLEIEGGESSFFIPEDD